MAITTEDKVAGLYAAFFNRAPDKAGLDDWIAKLDAGTSTLNDIAAGFADTPTFQDNYAGMDNETFVKAVYVNVLGKEGDAKGIADQLKALTDGTYATKADFVAGFVDSTLTIDLNNANFNYLTADAKAAAQERQDLLQNKVQVSEDFVTKLGDSTNVSDTATNATALANDPAYKASIKILSGVTADDATVTTAMGAIEKLAATPDTAMATLNAMPKITDDATAIENAQTVAAAQLTQATQNITDATNGASDTNQNITLTGVPPLPIDA